MEERHKLLVARLVDCARRRPMWFRLRVVALVALGYLYLLALTAGSLAASVAIPRWSLATGVGTFGSLMIALGLFVFGLFLFVSLWVRVPAPAGVEVTREQAPALFGAVGRVAERLACPVPDHVLIDGDFNVGAFNVPRFGIFGGRRRYLRLGYPLLCSLSAKHLDAIVGHEIRHLSARQGTLGIWIYRIQRSWEVLLTGDRPQKGGFEIGSLFRWYRPIIGAHAFALTRASEYEADRMAADAAGLDVAIEALSAVWVLEDYYRSKVLPSMRRLLDEQEEPPRGAMLGAWARMAEPVPPEDAESATRRAINRVTDCRSAHPAPRDRVAALAGEPAGSVALRLPEAAGAGNSAAALLGAAREAVAEQLDAQLVKAMRQEWAVQHRARCRAKELLARLTAKAQSGTISAQEARERVCLIGSLCEGDEAIAALREFVEAQPDDAGANLLLGRALIEAGRREGLEYLDDAMRRDRACIVKACRAAYPYVLEYDGHEAAKKYRAAEEQEVERQRRACEERTVLSRRDRFQPPDLSAEHIEAIRATVAADPSVKRAYVVRKLTQEMADRPFYVIAVVPVWVVGYVQWARDSQLRERLTRALDLPVEALVIVLRGEHVKLYRPISRVPGAEIYRRQ